MSDKINILLLEDDEALAMGLEYSLKKEGYSVTRLSSYKEGVAFIKKYSAHDENFLALFDVMLPDGNGFMLLEEMRKAGIDIPVIFLTAVSDEINVVQGLDIGADDYITKPFKVKELLSRIKAVARRYNFKQNLENTPAITYKNLLIDESMATVKKYIDKEKDYETIELTSNEYKLLLYFVHNQGILLERNKLLERLFNTTGSYVDDNTLSVYIRRLREKLGSTNDNSHFIKTVHGLGYIMERENA